MSSTDYTTARTRLENSLRLGITVESEDGNPLSEIVTTLTEEQISWIGSWLAGDGFGATTAIYEADTEDDGSLTTDTPACRACGTWVCAGCGLRRDKQSRYDDQPITCSGCYSTEGALLPVHHQEQTHKKHLTWYVQLEASFPCQHPLVPVQTKP